MDALRLSEGVCPHVHVSRLLLLLLLLLCTSQLGESLVLVAQHQSRYQSQSSTKAVPLQS